MTASQTYSPYEMGLDRLVRLDKGPYIGREALAREQSSGSSRKIVGLEASWPEVERLYEAAGLPPQMPSAASRVAVPVYRRGRQIGRATTTTWSPTLKKLIALATLSAPHFAEGTAVELEMTVDAVRHQVPAVVVSTPFFNPPRKTAVPAGEL